MNSKRVYFTRPTSSNGFARPSIMALMRCLRKDGWAISHEGRPPPPGSLAVGWGHVPHNRMLQRNGVRLLLLELGYIDRHNWYSLQFDGICRTGLAPIPDDRGDRWKRVFDGHIKPWRDRPDGDIVIVGQIETDANVQGHDIVQFYWDAAEKLRPFGRVVFRPHPSPRFRMPRLPDWLPIAGPGFTMKRFAEGAGVRRDLIDSFLDQARAVVTLSSNTAVEAVFAGVPTIAMSPRSMAWDVTSHTLDRLPEPVDRQDWFERLAWKQWTFEEIEDGTAWDTIKAGLDIPYHRNRFSDT